MSDFETSFRLPSPPWLACVFGRGRRRRGGKVVKDRALGTIVAVAGMDEPLQRPRHRSHVRYAGVDVGQVLFSKAAHLARGPAPVAPKRQQRGDLVKRETQIPGPPDELEHRDFRVAIVAITVVATVGRFNEAYALIIADHLRRYARLLGGHADVHFEFAREFFPLTFPLWEGADCFSSQTRSASARVSQL